MHTKNFKIWEQVFVNINRKMEEIIYAFKKEKKPMIAGWKKYGKKIPIQSKDLECFDRLATIHSKIAEVH